MAFREWQYFVAGVLPFDEDEGVACRIHPGLEGPLTLGVVPHRGFVVVHHGARWYRFLEDMSERERLRRSCKLIARALGARRVVYVADLAIEEIAEHGLYDEPFGRVVASLHEWWGDACSLASAYPDGDWKQYFFENA